MGAEKALVAVVIVGMICFAGFAVSRADLCRAAGNKSIACAVGLESAQ